MAVSIFGNKRALNLNTVSFDVFIFLRSWTVNWYVLVGFNTWLKASISWIRMSQTDLPGLVIYLLIQMQIKNNSSKAMKLPQFCPGMYDVRNKTTVFICINPLALLLTWICISLPLFL